MVFSVDVEKLLFTIFKWLVGEDLAEGKGWAQGQGRPGSACGGAGRPRHSARPLGQRHWERACHSAGFLAIQVQEGPPIRTRLPWKGEFFLTAPGSTGHSMPWGKGHIGKLQGQWTAAQVQEQEPLLLFPWEGAGEAERLGLAALGHFRALGHRSCLWSSE